MPDNYSTVLTKVLVFIQLQTIAFQGGANVTILKVVLIREIYEGIIANLSPSFSKEVYILYKYHFLQASRIAYSGMIFHNCFFGQEMNKESN